MPREVTRGLLDKVIKAVSGKSAGELSEMFKTSPEMGHLFEYLRGNIYFDDIPPIEAPLNWGKGRYVHKKNPRVSNRKEFLKEIEACRGRLVQYTTEAIRNTLNSVKEDATKGMMQAYGKMMSDEGGDDTLNNKIFQQVDPQTILALQQPVLTVTDSARTTKIQGLLFNIQEMDEIDRKGPATTVKVLIKANRGDIIVNGVKCAVKEIEIHARSERRKDKTGHVWNTWRVIEYGGTVQGNRQRVRAKTVQSVSKGPDGKATVVYGPDVVFMSARSKWWRMVSDKRLGNVSIDTPKYWGGSAPIRNSVSKNKQVLDREIRKAIRKAMGR
jgi:hypothetical protein